MGVCDLLFFTQKNLHIRSSAHGFILTSTKASTTADAIPEFTYLRGGAAELYFAFLDLDESRFFCMDVKISSRAATHLLIIKLL